MRETHRFETLVNYFTNPQEFQIEFMVACMQFINIVVHSVEDMNFRVALQYEFTALYLDDCLERLGHHESDEMGVQISAYVDNEFDVAALMEDAETKQAALDQVADLEEELGRVSERLTDTEAEAMSQQLGYENSIEELQREINQIAQIKQEVESEYSTLKRTVENKEEEGKRRQSMLEVRIKELEIERDKLKTASNSSLSSTQSAGAPVIPAAAPPPPPPPAPPAPPPPPMLGAPPPPRPPRPPGPPGPPPPPGMSAPNLGTQTIKRAIKTTYRLPTLQLQVLKPNDTKDTFWYTTNDEKIINEIDFSAFEEAFKLNPAPLSKRGKDESDQANKTPTIKAPQLKSLMEHTRLKNVAICKRRLPQMPLDDIIAAVNALDNNALTIDAIELLQRIEPNADEIRAYREFNFKKNNPEELTAEDRFMLKLSKVERLPAKLEIMSFMSSYYELLHKLTPQIDSICLASKSPRNSKKFKKILEIILAFGNYMNY